MKSTVTATPIQKIGLTPRNRLAAQSDSPTGTALWTGNVRTYRLTIPTTIWPVARVTIRALSLSPPIRIPFTNPIRAATPTAVRIAIQIRPSDCLPTPAMIIADSVKVPGVLRSMPPVMITNIWPSAVIARSAANGAMADKATLLSVSGTQIEATTTSTIRAK